MKFILFLIFIFTLFQTALTQEPDAPKGYLIAPGDEVTGKVLHEPQFDFVATVDEDGMIGVPFVEKEVMAKCRTERELRSEVTKQLTKFLRNPQVSIRVTQRNSPPVSVYGEVRQQQRFSLTRQARLLELISFAGGVTEKSGGIVQVFRTRPPMCADAAIVNEWKAETGDGLDVPSKLYSLNEVRGGREEANPEIFPGDIVVVQRAAPVYVVGEVIKPGEMDIPEGGLTLMQAIGMASGITREAKTKNIKIYRRKIGSQPEKIAVNYDQIRKGQQKDVVLQALDIVEVDKAAKSIGDIMMDVITGLPNRIPIPIRPF